MSTEWNWRPRFCSDDLSITRSAVPLRATFSFVHGLKAVPLTAILVTVTPSAARAGGCKCRERSERGEREAENERALLHCNLLHCDSLRFLVAGTAVGRGFRRERWERSAATLRMMARFFTTPTPA